VAPPRDNATRSISPTAAAAAAEDSFNPPEVKVVDRWARVVAPYCNAGIGCGRCVVRHACSINPSMGSGIRQDDKMSRATQTHSPFGTFGPPRVAVSGETWENFVEFSTISRYLSMTLE
jgi:hypothetical protein